MALHQLHDSEIFHSPGDTCALFSHSAQACQPDNVNPYETPARDGWHQIYFLDILASKRFALIFR